MENSFFSDLLLQIPNSNLTEGTINLNTSDLQPYFDQAEVTIIGNPTIAVAPLGNGLHVTTDDRVVYKFPVSKPWPCPFDIAECPTGITVSFWFRRNYVMTSTQKDFFRFGKVFRIYTPHGHKYSVISMRWFIEGNSYVYGYSRILSGKWNLVSWVINNTHTISYVNGVRKHIGQRNIDTWTVNVNINNELYVGGANRALRANFSVGSLRLWAGRMSPVYMWRQFQEGLPDQNE